MQVHQSTDGAFVLALFPSLELRSNYNNLSINYFAQKTNHNGVEGGCSYALYCIYVGIYSETCAICHVTRDMSMSRDMQLQFPPRGLRQ